MGGWADTYALACVVCFVLCLFVHCVFACLRVCVFVCRCVVCVCVVCVCVTHLMGKELYVKRCPRQGAAGRICGRLPPKTPHIFGVNEGGLNGDLKGDLRGT